MDPLLIERWLGPGARTAVSDEASVVELRAIARETGRALGFDDVAAGRLATVASELATNQLRHAIDGAVAFRPVTRDGVAGVEVVAADGGNGISDAATALDGASRSTGSLGAGLSGVQRLATEVDFDVRLGTGTCVRARVFATDVRRRREVAILARPYPGERTHGDDATFVRHGESLVLALADGVGHGADARDPARRAIDLVHASAGDAPARLLDAADTALHGTRGAVMAVVRIDERAGTLAHAAVGNITTTMRGSRARSYAGMHRILGAHLRHRSAVVEEVDRFAPGDLVLMFSDGLRSRLDPGDAKRYVSRHPLALAQHLLDAFARHNDDATLIVVR